LRKSGNCGETVVVYPLPPGDGTAVEESNVVVVVGCEDDGCDDDLLPVKLSHLHSR
jgi:hypothetical protein